MTALGESSRPGWAGLLVAGSCFILPAALIVTGFAWAYMQYGALAQTAHILYGIKSVIIAVGFHALGGLTHAAAKTKFLAMVGLVAVALNFLGVYELIILLGAGAIVGLRQ